MKLFKPYFVVACSFLVLTSVIAKADFVSCQSHLRNYGGLYGAQAAQFCLENSSPAFMNCQSSLSNYGGLYGVQAAQFCLKNSSLAFVRCQSNLRNYGGMYGVQAANTCIDQQGD